jgi:hypothetical protein
MEKTIQDFLDLTEKFDIRIGEYEGKTFAIFEGWEQLEQLVAYANGFEGLKGSKPYLKSGQSLHDKYLEAKALSEANPDHWGYKRDKEVALTHSLYAQYMAGIEDPISLDSFEDLDWGFSDEYDICCNCSNVIRTSPDSYSWTAPLFLDCEGYVCDDCVATGNYNDYILEEFCNVEKSIPDQFNLDDLGLVKINDDSYQNGLHYGMDDSPKPIIKRLNDEGIDVWFKVYPSQFNVDFDVYVKAEHKDRAKDILSNTNTYQGFSSAGNCEKALKAASTAMDNLEGEGIKYAKINSDGTANVRLVSPEEFIKGIKD